MPSKRLNQANRQIVRWNDGPAKNASEDEAALQDLRAVLIHQYRPANVLEEILVDQLAQNIWRLGRARRYETAMLNRNDPDSPGAGFNAKDFHFHRRYQADIEKSFYRMKETLERAIARRLGTANPSRNPGT